MKHLSGLWHKLTVVVAVTAALSSCNRAEYAMLPKTSSYHGTTTHRAVTVAPTETPAPTVAETNAPAASPVVAAAPAVVTPTPEPVTAATAPKAAVAAKKTSVPATSVAKATPTKAPKLNLIQRAAVSKIAKRVDKVADKTLFNKHREAAKASRLSGKLRQAVILGLVGLLLEIIGAAIGGGIGAAFYIVGAVLLIVALVLLVIYLLDEL